VFASLIIPALATREARSKRLLKAYAVGAIGFAAGLVVSLITDLPTGAIIVWSMALCGIVFSTLERSKAVTAG
jgi:zinc/manganese transport system permease protein